jgi:ElaB/YqjD/DUF883 family membrane-anchored ribosome-binding protein
MDQKTDVIRDQMEDTRASLGKKIEALENTVVGSVKEVAETATETVTEVTEAVEGTVETVTEAVSGATEAVQSALDFPGHVRRHPWISLGGAFVVGVLTGRLLHSSRSTERKAGQWEPSEREDGRWKRWQEKQARRESRRSEEGEGWLHSLGEGFEEMIQDVKNLALGATLSFARDLMTQSASEGMKPHIAGLIDRFTSRLGAQPIEGSDASSSDEGHEDDDDEDDDTNGHSRSGQGARRQQSGDHHKGRGKKRGSRK